MCLAVPVRVVAIEEDGWGQVEVSGVQRRVSLRLVPEVGPGDYVLLHAGYAIARVDEEEARETLRLIEEMDALSG